MLPISVTASKNLLYVLNAGSARDHRLQDRRQRTRRVARTARRQPLLGTAPAQVAFSPDGSELVVTEKGSSTLDTFAVVGGIAQPGVSSPSAGATPFGFAFDGLGRAFVSEAAGFGVLVRGRRVRRARDHAAPSATHQAAPCWLVVTPDGRFAYTANAGRRNDLGLLDRCRTARIALLDPYGATAVLGAGSSSARRGGQLGRPLPLRARRRPPHDRRLPHRGRRLAHAARRGRDAAGRRCGPGVLVRIACTLRPVAEQDLIGTVAIVGFPNVGKSTLVNRLTGTRQAVVHETPGVTRDRKELVCEWRAKRFLLIDTGGVDIADQTPITRSIADQAREAVAEADLVLFVVDAQIGITPGDEEVAQILRESKKPVLVIANKIDDPRQETLALELHRLGLGDPIPISGLHGHGTGDLLDEIVDYLEAHGGTGRAELPEEAIRVAILGRPNVGKSSLVNKLLGQERVIVSEIPGTTRDAIDTVLQRGDRTFVLVDTAGLRRKRRHRQGIEYYSELRALEAAERADVALVLIDASEGIVDQDLAVADIARKADCATLIVLSKWDITTVELEDVRRAAAAPPAPAAATSSRSRRRPAAGSTACSTTSRSSSSATREGIPTPELEPLPSTSCARSAQPPSRNGKRLNLLYAAQIHQRPPRFRIFVNDPALITRDYGYWVENELRERFGLEGVPVSIDFVKRHVRFLVAGAGSWGTAFTHVLLERGHDVVLALPHRRAGGCDRRDGTQSALRCRRSTCAASRRCRSTTRPATSTSSSSRCRARRSPTSSRALPGDAPVLSLTKGLDPATGERLSTRVDGRPVAVLSGPNMAEEIAVGLPTAAVIASDDGYLAGQLQHAINSTVFRVVREPRRRRRRALRRREERDRARGGRRRRPRARRQLEGLARSRAASPRWRGSARRPARGRRRSPGSRAWAT